MVYWRVEWCHLPRLWRSDTEDSYASSARGLSKASNGDVLAHKVDDGTSQHQPLAFSRQEGTMGLQSWNRLLVPTLPT